MTPRPKKRRSRPYDSARTAPRSTGQRSVSRPSGYQEQELTFETRRAPSQNTTRSRAYDFESQRPQQGTSRPRAYDFEGQRPRQGTSRPRQDNSIQFPTQQVRRPAGGSSQNKTVHTGQRLRPAQNQPQRRKHRRMTRAEMRRRRLARRLTAFGLLLCVIGAGVYLTVTMLFKINTIQLQLADTTPVEQAADIPARRSLPHWGWPAARISSVLTQMPRHRPWTAVPPAGADPGGAGLPQHRCGAGGRGCTYLGNGDQQGLAYPLGPDEDPGM